MRRLLSVVGTLFLVLTLVLPTASFGQEATPTADSDGMVEVQFESTPEYIPDPETPEIEVIPPETSETPVLVPETPEASAETPEATEEPPMIAIPTEPTTETAEPTVTAEPGTTIDSTEVDTPPATTPASIQANEIETSPSAVVIPWQGNNGDTLTLNLTGFVPNELLILDFPDGDQGQASFYADRYGNAYYPIVIDEPEGQQSVYKIFITSSTSGIKTWTDYEAYNDFGSSFYLEPQRGLLGSTVTARGHSFEPHEKVEFSWALPSNPPFAVGFASADGTLNFPITIPNWGFLGSNSIYVSGSSGKSSTNGSFTVLSTDPTVNASQRKGNAGSSVTLSGSGFSPHEPLSVHLTYFTNEALTTTSANGYGEFHVEITLPADLGPQLLDIYVVGRSDLAHTDFTITPAGNPSASVSPTSGLPGDELYITGSHYEPFEQVTIRWGNTYGPIIGYANVNYLGTFYEEITVPEDASPGITEIAFQGRSSRGGVTFTVNGPTMSVSPTTGLPGERLSVSGENFAPGERVNIRWGSDTGPIIGYKNATSSGTISGAILVPADAASGTHDIYLQSASATTTTSFTVIAPPSPTVSISLTSGLPGARLSVTGTNFASGERVNIRWGNASGPILGYKNASSNGSFSGAILVPANASAGSTQIYLQSASGTTSVVFSVTAAPAPTITVSPTSGLPGARLSVSGTNFKSGERVNIRWGSSTGPILGYKNASSNGSFSGAILVPANASAGATQIYLQSASGTASTVFTVKAQPKANVSISENYVTQGDIISIQGWNYRPGETVTITLPGNITLGRVTVRDNGTFSGRIKIPATLPEGYHTITSRGGSSGFAAGIRVEVWGYIPTEVRLNPSSGAAGSVMRFTGSGFQPGERVSVSWRDETTLGTVTASPTGTISGAITVPRTATAGSNLVWFRGQSSDQYDLQFFDVTRVLNPTATISPSSAKGGDIVTVTGSNFRPGETVTIYWSKQFGPTIGVVTASSNGSISGKVSVPRSALAGNHSIVVVGIQSYSPVSKTITVTTSPVAKVTLSSSSGPANHIIYISGSGFGPDEIVQITWNIANGENIGLAWTDQNGAFTNWTILTPWDSSLGTYRIYAVGEISKRTTSTTYTVTRTLIHRDSVRHAHSPVWNESIRVVA